MPTPRHPRHPPATLSLSPYHPHPPQLLSIRYPLTTLYRIDILNLYIRTSPHPTSSPPYSTSMYAPRPDLLPHVLTQPSAALSYPSVQLSIPLPHALTPSSAPHSHPSTLLPTPFPCTLRAPFCRKVCTPPPKASSNPPVEIFCSKRRRRLILNILPRRHHVDNSVSSSVHSEEKA